MGDLLSDFLSALAIIGIFAFCEAIGWACERAFSRPVEHEAKRKITVR